MNRARPTFAPVRFSTVLAPPVADGNSRATPATCYARVIEHARQHHDLVVIDTQLLDAESSDLFDDVFLPALRSGGWGLVLTDDSRESIENVPVVLKQLADARIRPARILLAATLFREGEFDEAAAAAFTNHFAGRATFVGSTVRDAEFASDLAVGRVDIDSPAVRPMLRSVLHTVTGLDRFAPEADPEPAPKRRWWRRAGR